jgi:hypothetical protein
MNRREFNRIFGALAVTPVLRRPVPTVGGWRWSLTADVAECCSCEIPCPCNFGRPSDPCYGTRLIQITEGDFEGADLEGITFAVTFFRTRWTRVYISEGLSDAKADALDGLLPAAFNGFVTLARDMERVPLTINRSADTFRFSVPESTVEMRLLPGLNGDPITITGLPSNAYHDYVQYESVVHSHSSADANWS